MLQYIHILGIEINLYQFFFYMALTTVPIMLFALRKTFGYSWHQTAFYSCFTLAFGYFSAILTASLKRVMLGFASGGLYTDTERLRNYGIPMFLPLFLFLYCRVRKDDFKKLSDYIAPCVYSVMTFVKVGCVFWGCCYGEPDEHGIWNAMLECRTFPVQLYDALTSLIIVIICLCLIWGVYIAPSSRRGEKEESKREGTGRGYVYPIGGILFALTKGFWESFRVHESEYERHFLGTGWTLWQYWLLVLLIGCLVWLIICKKTEKARTPAN